MAKNKERLLFLLKSLMNTSDGASDYTLKELEELYENNGLSATQKTIRNDISKLIEAGFEIEEYSEPGKPTHYSCRLTFEKPELKMIIDAVMAANFISASKCQQLVEKLMSLAGENAKDVLSSGTDTSSHLTKPNAGFFINIDTISEAIRQKKKIRFQYFDYNLKKQRILHNDGEVYTYSPFGFTWNDDRYYILGIVDKRPGIINPMRVDLITNLSLLDDDALPKPEGFSLSQYSQTILRMYQGEETTVVLEADNSLVKKFIDQYGEGFRITRASDQTFYATITASVSPTFFSWVFQYDGKIQIVSPDEVRNQYADMLSRLLAYYGKMSGAGSVSDSAQ